MSHADKIRALLAKAADEPDERDRARVQPHTAPTGEAWFIIVDGYGCRVGESDIVYYDTFDCAAREAARLNVEILGIVPNCLNDKCGFPDGYCPCSLTPEQVLIEHEREQA